MKKFFTLSALLVAFVQSRADEVISGYITQNTTLTNDKIWLLQGFVYVTNGATLTIEPGTIIKGDKATKGALIITRGAKLIANGTAQQPIVFTSNGPVGFRNYGDWGGIILLGRASINQPGGEAVIEGGVEDGQGNGTYGGGLNPDDNDNSGILRYVRIEFCGIAFQPNSEINGLTCGGVGRGTTLEYIQVSFCGDDAFEFFGGTVNAKYLISYRTLDDDFDTDNGYRGLIQFAYALRDPAIADVSGSNGFESDNDPTGSPNTPFTQTVFSNITIAGPRATSSTSINGSYRRAAHLRRNTRTSIYNSVLMGFPTGIMIDGSACEANATNDILQVRNTVISGCTNNFEVASGSTFDISGWFNNASYNNKTYSSNTALGLKDPFNLTNPNPLPSDTSLLLSGADFTHAALSDPFFTQVTYRGAFGTVNWTEGWAEWNPNNVPYTGISESATFTNLRIFPNPAAHSAVIQFSLATQLPVHIFITDLSGRHITDVIHETMAGGSHQAIIDLSQWARGSYLVKLKAGNSSAIHRLNVL
ncbi:MAG: T9SS type A sorting domain-containing protein [Chitinophagales bacterium]|nr:T9SS type A sorting domain-containing protein [Chitinophagales bacterium]MDW8428700.1 T9SS type A sorting domain-containing protein [Chitinophagales bacterium]